jgi:nucleoside-diphosphate-sugar epimerase
VTGLDSFLYRGCDFGESAEFQPALEVDVRDVGPSQLEGFDAVVHLAALSNDPLGDLNPGWTYDVNLDGTVSLARAAKQAGVSRFVFASSCSMYGAADTAEALDESAPLRPLTPYAESKVRAEAAMHELAGDGFSPVAMRNATVYGVSPRLRLDIVLNNLVAWAHTTGAIRLQSDGSAWRPLVHVRDVAEAANTILAAPVETVHDEAFNIGSDAQNYTIRELAETVRVRMPECEVEFAEGAVADPRSYRVDFSKFAFRFPEFHFEHHAEDGVAELVDAYERTGLTLDEFQGHRYIRLGQIKRLLAAGQLDDDLRSRQPV